MNRRVVLIALSLTLALSIQGFMGIRGSAKVQAKSGSASAAVQTTAATVAAIVELENEPVGIHQRLAELMPQQEIDFEAPSARAYEAQLDDEHASFKSRATLVSPNLRVRTELRKLVNAVSIEVSESELAAIAALPGVKHVELVKEYHVMLDASVPLINAPALWDRLGGVGVAGQGMKIAILDTGIDITNPLFSDTGYSLPSGFPKTNNGSAALTNNKVIVAKSFIRPASDASDQFGHGSNVAGIAAGSVTTSPLATISGVAPMAYLGNYRVLDINGAGGTDLIARGIEEAVSDGFDVLSMSLGGSAGSSLDIAAMAAEAAVASGRVVVVAAGNNSGDMVGQPMTIASPGIAPSAITVGAASNSHIAGPKATALISVLGSNDMSLMNVNAPRGDGAVDPQALDGAIGPLPYVDVSTLDGGNRACGLLALGSLAGKIALIERGNCTFASKINAADQAGARAVIIYNKDVSEGSDGGEDLFAFGADGTNILSVLVKRSTGLSLRTWLQAHPDAQLSILPQPIGEVETPPDVLATFSALGPSVIEGLKPDIAAPGLSIYSAAIKMSDSKNNPVVDPTGFLAISGTSQATPHVAGAAALIKQLNPAFTQEQIKSALVSSATTDVFTVVDKTTRAGVLATGGGRVDVARASSVTATFSPASLSFGIRKLKRTDVSVPIDLNITSVIDGQNNFTVSVQQLDPGEGVTVTPSGGSVLLARGQTRAVTITIAAIAGSQRRDYTGYIVVTGAGQTLHVPYWIRYVKKKT
jgi:minor extracellular serine protease Vpr